MDHQIPEALPSVELPKMENIDQIDGGSVSQNEAYTENTATQALERGASTAPSGPASQQQTQYAGQPAPVVAPHDAPPSGVTGVAMTPQIADDTDLIEKEWVEKAKEIVSKTRHDPYLQNKEMTKVKADYLKKRYNKDIKLERE